MPADIIFTVTTQAMSLASRGQGRGVADDPIILNLCPLPSNVKLQHLLNDCGVSLGQAPGQLVTLTRCTFIFRSEKKGRELLRPHRLSINFKGKNRVLKAATPWSGTGQVQEAKSCKSLLQRP